MLNRILGVFFALWSAIILFHGNSGLEEDRDVTRDTVRLIIGGLLLVAGMYFLTKRSKPKRHLWFSAELYDRSSRSHTYDAAGRQVKTRELSQSSSRAAAPSPINESKSGGGGIQPGMPVGGYYTTTTLTLAQSYDGDGQSTKRVQTEVQSTPFYQPVTTESVIYYVRSSVMKGQVVTQVNRNGGKGKTNVYAGNHLIAEQQLYDGGAEGITWKYENPVTGTTIEVGPNNLPIKSEYDPFGLELGETDRHMDNMS